MSRVVKCHSFKEDANSSRLPWEESAAPAYSLGTTALDSADNRRNHYAYTVIPIDSMCCFCWASKGASKLVCMNNHIVFQTDRCRWNTDFWKLNKASSLKAARVASCVWKLISFSRDFDDQMEQERKRSAEACICCLQSHEMTVERMDQSH